MSSHESEEVVVEAIKRQRRAAYKEYCLTGVPSQDQRLHNLAVAALQAIYAMPMEECMKRFLEEDQETVKYLVQHSLALHPYLSRPSVEALLALKDCLHIPDDHWQVLQSTFNLGCEHIHPTPGGKGFHIVCHPS